MKLDRLAQTIILLISCCTSLTAQTQLNLSNAQSRLGNTKWRLSSFSAAGGESPVVKGTTVTIKFSADGRVGGSGGCNSYSGQFQEHLDTLSFGQIISTKRACLDQAANQQEQQYFTALGSAGKFKLAENQLVIFYGTEERTLNFVSESSDKATEQRYEILSSPVDLLASFYNAVNTREFERGYHYWENPPRSFPDFERGYGDTLNVQLIVQPPTNIEGAAGSLFAAVPAVIVTHQRDGSDRLFAGCYVARKSNLGPNDVPKEQVWRIYKAKLSPLASATGIPKVLAEACKD